MKKKKLSLSSNNVVSSGNVHSSDQMLKGSRIMNRRERRALKKANLSRPETVIKVLSPNEVLEPTVLYSTETTADADPEEFIAEIKNKISQTWSVLGDIKASYSYQNKMGGIYSYLFTFNSDLITAEAYSYKMAFLKLAGDYVSRKLALKAKSTMKVDAAFAHEAKIMYDKIIAEMMRSMCIVIVARPRHADNFEAYQIETGAFDCLKKHNVKEIGVSRSETQIVVVAYLEKDLPKEDLYKFSEEIQSRFTGAQFFIDAGIYFGERAAELANRAAFELKSYSTSNLAQQFTGAMLKIWFSPFIRKEKEEDKKASQKLCAR